MAGAATPGLAVSEDGLTLALDRSALPRGEATRLGFRVLGEDGEPVRDFEAEQTKRMHLIVVRRDTQGFQHLHPRMDRDGHWSTAITVPEAGSYRVFADFKRDGEKATLGADLAVDGPVGWRALPAPAPTTTTAGGYEVRIAGGRARAGHEADLGFEVSRGGEPVEPEPYLGARGHLVALREGDLAYLHTHPSEHGGAGDPVRDRVPDRGPLPPVLPVQARRAGAHRRLHPGGDAMRSFIRHYIEMLVAMLVGMAVIGIPLLALTESTELDLLAMAFSMSVLMVAWMRHRGHGWTPAAEMTASMFLPSFAAIGLLWGGVVEDRHSLMMIQHIAMFPLMLGAMLLRPREYSGRPVHA